MLRRRVTGVYKGIHLPLIAPEDLFVIKALTASEANPQHFYDALAIIPRHDALDWDYLLQRARQVGSRRVLSLLPFAASIAPGVPTDPFPSPLDVVHPRLATTRCSLRTDHRWRPDSPHS